LVDVQNLRSVNAPKILAGAASVQARWTAAYNWDNANDVSYSRIPRPYYRTRWDLTVYDRPTVVRRHDAGLTWSELRRVSLERSRRSFFVADRNRDGGLNKGELRACIDQNGDEDDYQPAPRPYLPLAYYRTR
jgi:hypothetical protein